MKTTAYCKLCVTCIVDVIVDYSHSASGSQESLLAESDPHTTLFNWSSTTMLQNRIDFGLSLFSKRGNLARHFPLPANS